MLNKAFYIILFLSLSCCVQAQKIMRNTSLLNYQRGDRTVLHFGFSLGINYMDYKAVLSGANGWRAESGKLDVGFLVAPPKKVHKCFSHMKTLELEIVQGFFFYPHYAFRYIFVKLDFANSVAFFKAFEKAINMYHTSLFFNCLTISISGVKK